MAIICGMWDYRDHRILLLHDPNRYRVTIWAKRNSWDNIYPIKVRRMHDKDKERILKRATQWLDEQRKE